MDRYSLYKAYWLEMERFSDENASEAEIESRAKESFARMQEDKSIRWIDIEDKTEKEIVGFLIVQASPKFIDADFHICDAYILPSYRSRGNMNRAVSKLVHLNPARYSLKIDERNIYGYRFWHTMFSDIMFYDESFGYPKDTYDSICGRTKQWYIYTPHRLGKGNVQ